MANYQIEPIEAPIELTLTGQEKAENDAKIFARDTKKELDPLLVQDLRLNLAQFQSKLDEARARLKAAKKAGDKEAEFTARLNVNKLQSDTTEARRILNNYVNTGSQSLSRLGALFNSLGTQIKNAALGFFGLGALLGLLAGIANGFRKATEDAISFETAFAGVAKTVDASDAELKLLRTELEQLSTEIVGSFEEVAKIAELGGQLGVGINDITKFTKTVSQIAATTNLTSEAAATAFARIANVTGLPLENIDRLASVVVRLGNNFAANEAEILNFTQNLASAGTVAGLLPQDIAAISVALASAGVNAEAGGTAISTSFLEIQKAVIEGTKDLQLLSAVSGKTTADFKKAWKDDAGQAFADFVDGLSKQGDDAIGVIEELFGSNTRTRNAFLSLALASDKLRDALALSNDEFAGGTALLDEYNKRLQTSESQIGLLNDKIRLARVEIGETGKGFTIFWKQTQLFALLTFNAIADSFSKIDGFIKRNIAGLVLFMVSKIREISQLLDNAGLLSDGLASTINENLARIGKNATDAIEKYSEASIDAAIKQRAANAQLTVSLEDVNAELNNTPDIKNLLGGNAKATKNLKDRAEELKREIDELYIGTDEFNEKWIEYQKIQKAVNADVTAGAKTFGELRKEVEEATKATKKGIQDKGVAYVKSFDEAIQDTVKNVEKLKDELAGVVDDLAGIEQDIGQRILEIEKSLSDIDLKIATGESEQSDIDEKRKLEEELALARANINQDVLDEIRRQDALSETEKLIEKQAALELRQQELIDEIAFEEELNKNLTEAKEEFLRQITETYGVELEKQTTKLAEEAAKQIALYRQIEAAAKAAANAGASLGGGVVSEGNGNNGEGGTVNNSQTANNVNIVINGTGLSSEQLIQAIQNATLGNNS